MPGLFTSFWISRLRISTFRADVLGWVGGAVRKFASTATTCLEMINGVSRVADIGCREFLKTIAGEFVHSS